MERKESDIISQWEHSISERIGGSFRGLWTVLQQLAALGKVNYVAYVTSVYLAHSCFKCWQPLYGVQFSMLKYFRHLYSRYFWPSLWQKWYTLYVACKSIDEHTVYHLYINFNNWIDVKTNNVVSSLDLRTLALQ